MKYNFNLTELREKSKTNADVLCLLYLSFHHSRYVGSIHQIVDELELDDYPTIDFDFYTIPEYGTKKIFSMYRCKNPNAYLKSLEVFKCAVSDAGKVRYLELCTICNTPNKFLPVVEVPNELVLYGLVESVPQGIILTPER